MKSSFGRAVSSVFIRHSEELLLALALALIAFCLWLAWKMWHHRKRVFAFVCWFVGISRQSGAPLARAKKSHGITVLFFDILALFFSLIATGVISGIVSGTLYVAVWIHIKSHYHNIMSQTRDEWGCQWPSHQTFCCDASSPLGCAEAEALYYSAHNRFVNWEIAAGTVVWLLSFLIFLFIAPRMFRFVRRRYLE
ncbi:MAG: hypothetical protein ACR2QC_03295 [Gammaproteobacteria bacterium]